MTSRRGTCWTALLIIASAIVSTPVRRTDALEPLQLADGTTITSTDATGRFVVVAGPAGLSRIDRLKSTVTALPPLVALSDDGWFGITADATWHDLSTGASIALPSATGYDLSGDGRTVIGRDDTLGTSSFWIFDVSTGIRSALPIPGPPLAMSSNGRYVLIESCRVGRPCDSFRRWDRASDQVDTVAGAREDVIPIISDSGRVVVRLAQPPVAPTPFVVRDIGGKQRHFELPKLTVDFSFSADGRYVAYVARPTLCCRIAGVIQIDSGFDQVVVDDTPHVLMRDPLQAVVSGNGSTLLYRLSELGIGTFLAGVEVSTAVAQGRLRPFEALEVPVAGAGGVGPHPAAVMMNATVTNPATAGYLTIWPCDQPRPTTSNLNFVAGQTIANAVLAAVAPNGTICVMSNTQVDIVIDTQGWFDAPTPYNALTPTRTIDTRHGEIDTTGNIAAFQTLGVRVAGTGGVGAHPSAVMINATVTNPADPGYLTVWPCDQPRPTTSNINFVAGQTIANAVLATVAPDGTICAMSNTQVDVVIDTEGWFDTTSTPTYNPLTPTRAVDTRRGEIDTTGNIAAFQTFGVPVAGIGGVGAHPSAVMVNATVTNPADPGYLTVWPCDQPRPATSNINFIAGQTIANAVLTTVSALGTICVVSNTPLDVIVDIQGWFDTPSSYQPLTPARILDSRG
jgi:hypothetical protein